MANFDAGELLHVVGEYRSFVEMAIVIAVFEDEDAIAEPLVDGLRREGFAVAGVPDPTRYA